MSFTTTHNHHLNPERHTDPGPDPYPPKFGWHLYRDHGAELVDIFQHPDEDSVEADVMHNWMVDHGWYGDADPDTWHWRGNDRFVAVEPAVDTLPTFTFFWKQIDPYHLQPLGKS